MSWLDPFIVFVKDSVALPKRRTVVLGTGISAVDNDAEDSLTLSASVSTPPPPSATRFAYNLQSGAAGTAQATSAHPLLLGSCYFNPAILTGTVARFEAIIETSLAANLAYVDLYDLTANAVVAGSQLSTAAVVPTRVSVSLPAVLAASARIYQARLWMGPQDPAQLVACTYAALAIEV